MSDATPAAHDATRIRSAPCGRPRAVGIDYDGILTLGGRPGDDVLAAIERTRSHGIRVVLVTGRIGEELSAEFGDARQHFDALVLENGAEIDVDGHRFATAPPVDTALTDALTERAIGHRRGNVIVAASAADEHSIVDEITRARLECQLVHNRGELMILPPGVTKGSGFAAALGELGISAHDAVAIGDAENDHSLLASAELGVAVGNAIESLRSAADVALEQPGGEGVVELLDDLVGPADHWRRRRRSQIVLGHDPHGDPICIPARPSNVVIAAGSGEGKSYLAGLIAEQLVDMGYSVLLVDPEGDHVGLDTLRPVVVLGDDEPPPPPGVVVSLLKRSDASVIVDLSQLARADRGRYLADLPATIEAGRRQHGRPHWIIVDEAHYGFADGTRALATFDLASSGYCLVTWRPQDLPGPVVAATDVVITVTTNEPDPNVIDLTAAVAGESRRTVAEVLTGPAGDIVVVARDDPRRLRVARVARRRTEHFRHEHKYDSGGTPLQRGFWFRDDHDRPTGQVARSLHDLASELTRCDPGVIRHHAPLGDISRWIASVFHDDALAAAVATIERGVRRDSADARVESARIDLIATLQRRHHARRDGPGGQAAPATSA